MKAACAAPVAEMLTEERPEPEPVRVLDDGGGHEHEPTALLTPAGAEVTVL
jgi:hypothetical protein